MNLKEKAPEGLIPWIKEQKDINWPEYLIYKAGYYRDPLTLLKHPCADATCSGCGGRAKLGRAYDAECVSGNARFGVSWEASGKRAVYGSGSYAKCPMCGKSVTVLHSSAAKNLRRFIWPMSLERIGRNLVCYMWRVERGVDPDGSQWLSATPWEAVVFGEKSAGCYKHWYSWMYGHAYPDDKWTHLSEVKDRFFDIDVLYCPEGIAEITKGTCMENSKLELYMAVKGEYRFPIVWLRLYQRKHKAETLMTCGAAKLVAGIIAEEKARNYKTDWSTRLDCLKDLDWRKSKPAEILRLTKQELPYFTGMAKTDGVHRLRIIQQARKKGYTVRPGDEAGDTMRRDDQLSLLENGIKPSFVARYLDKQKRRYKGNASFYTLHDYWSMARRLNMPLNERDERFPQNLCGKHDELVALINERKAQKAQQWNESREKMFAERAERMSRYSWEHDGILIRPALSEDELRAEGKALSHCVATYAKRHAEGELTIFFIRRAEEPDKPWYTLTFIEEDLSVTQNLGNHNCPTTPEVKAFELDWITWIRAGCKREKKQEVSAA